MQRISFNNDWKIKQESTTFETPKPAHEITLPHDALFTSPRDKNAPNGTRKAFFINGKWEYTKTFNAPEDWRNKHIAIEFEGVYNQAKVYINDSFAGQRPFGYSEFVIDANGILSYGKDNTIKVLVQSGDDSRWYSGAGIYRNVNLLIADLVHVPANGIRLTTESASANKAVVRVETQVRNMSHTRATVRVKTEWHDPSGNIVAEDTTPITVTQGETATVIQRMCFKSPQLWNVDSPHLYTCKTTIVDQAASAIETRFGIRTLSLDTIDGLQLNGEPVKLRGCCIHHDNGVIGARTFASAEYRRIKKLKEAGFNAIRSAHHPASRQILDACDELGMLVMDESFDMWAAHKSHEDYSMHFDEWWERDIEAMVAKDYNHPCVIMYSIGNEIPDFTTTYGTKMARLLAKKVRELDNTRYTTVSINGMMYVAEKMQEAMVKLMSSGQIDINAAMANLGSHGNSIPATIPEIDIYTEEAFAALDIVGYNYMDSRYEVDTKNHPHRIFVGSETFTAQIPHLWASVMKNPNVIGDFCWTGWDYLGETGIGKIRYNQAGINHNFYGDYPWITAWCGDFDITGYRLPASYFREIVFDLRKEPYIGIQPSEHYHDTPSYSPWSFSSTVSSWSWKDYEGKPMKIEVYSPAMEVALYLNGELLDTKTVGEHRPFIAVFDIAYRPGTLEARNIGGDCDGLVYTLKTAEKEVLLHVVAEQSELSLAKTELAYVNISLADRQGIVHVNDERLIALQVEGAGELIGFGSGSPMHEENYLDNMATTYNGRAMAVIRPTGCGEIKIKATAQGCGEATTIINVKEHVK